jgi:DNA-binding NtrC family response regulator
MPAHPLRASLPRGIRYAVSSLREGSLKEGKMVRGAMRYSGERLLIVEDDQEMRDLLRKVLEKDGYQVSLAGDRHEAIALLAQGPFDLVVTDLLMPHDGGLELLTTIQQVYPAIPVIVTAFGDWHTYSRALELGAAAFISKPLHMAELIAAVHNALAKRSVAASP